MAVRVSEFEGWILKVADAVKAKHPNEDAHVELKAIWPEDPRKMARQLGGHANAAHGEPVLWIIGLDEKGGVVGAENRELADWLPAIEREFDGVAPTLLLNRNVPFDGLTLIGLYFETDRAPYVVRNPEHGKQGGGNIELEVPFRRGNSTRSARREDLLRVLVPVQRLPSIEVLSQASEISAVDKGSDGLRWTARIDLYFVPQPGSTVVIPFHKCAASIHGASKSPFEFENILLSPLMKTVGYGPVNQMSNQVSTVRRPESDAIGVTSDDVSFRSPGKVVLEAIGVAKEKSDEPPEAVELKMSFGYAGSDQTSDLLLGLRLSQPGCRWSHKNACVWKPVQKLR